MCILRLGFSGLQNKVYERDLNLWANLKSRGHAYNVFGLPLRPYVALYPWVDKWGSDQYCRSRKKGSDKVPINYFDFNFTDQLYFTRLNLSCGVNLKLTPITCMCKGIPVGRVRSMGGSHMGKVMRDGH